MSGPSVLSMSSPSCLDPKLAQMHTRADGTVKLYFRSWPLELSRYLVSVELPCGKCLPCRHAKANAWGNRVDQEARMHDSSCHITLTFDPEHYTGELDKRTVDLFFDRLRIAMRRDGLGKLRFFLVGEYGDQTERGHFHMVVFGQDFIEWCADAGMGDEEVLFSEKLSSLWGQGSVRVTRFGPGTAAYVAAHQWKAFQAERKPFVRFSRDPPIGFEFLRQFYDDFLRNGFVTNGKGVKQVCPAHYFNWQAYKDVLQPIKVRRRAFALERKARLEAAGFTDEDFARANRNRLINLVARSGLKRSQH